MSSPKTSAHCATGIRSAASLLSLLRSWIADGQYGAVFHTEEDTLTFAQFQSFDFQGMDELYPQVLEPLLFYIFQRISRAVYDPELVRSPKQLWADEVWRFLSKPQRC